MRKLFFLLSGIASVTAAPSVQFLKEFEAFAEQQRLEWEIPGMAVAIVQGDKVLFEKGFGQRGLDDKRPVTKDTLFQIGSLTKAFTSALVAMGVEEGKYKWDSPVSSLMTDFQMSDSWVTRQFEVQDLLSQRSGLPSYAGDNQSIVGFSGEEIYKNLVKIKSATSFRSSFAYQNVFFLAAARMMDKVGMGSYESLLQDRLFAPLEMTNSSATLKAYQDNPNSAEWALRQEDGSVVNLGRSYPLDQWSYTYAAAGGINSSIHDMAKWLQFQANSGEYQKRRLLTEESMNTMHRSYVYIGEKGGLPVYYALGWLHVEGSPYPIICHDGATMGVFNALGVVPEEKLGIVILTNMRGPEMSLALMFDFFNSYFDKKLPSMSQAMLSARKDKPLEKKPENPYPPMKLQAYEGVYSNAIYGDVPVVVEEGKLTLTIGPKKVKMYLNHWDRDTFTLFWPVMEETNSKVSFTLNGEMNIELFSNEGSGTFHKK